MKISIIIPVYNVEKYIERCFNSVANQTYHDIECIFVDDCTPDNSSQILRELISGYDGPIKFSIVKHDKNKGLSGARNTGTNLAAGEYIYYLDSDDEITPECIYDLVALAFKYPGVDIVLGSTRLVPPRPIYVDITRSKFPEYSSNRLWIKKHFFRKPKIAQSAWNKLIRKNFITENNLYFKEGIIHEDLHWTYFVAKKIHSIAFSKKHSYNYYTIPGSILNSGNYYKSTVSMIQIIQDMIENIDTELPYDQRLFIALNINIALGKIKTNTEEFAMIGQYRFLIKKLMKDALKNFRFHETVYLTLLLIPNFWGIRIFTQAVMGSWRHFK